MGSPSPPPDVAPQREKVWDPAFVCVCVVSEKCGFNKETFSRECERIQFGLTRRMTTLRCKALVGAASRLGTTIGAEETHEIGLISDHSKHRVQYHAAQRRAWAAAPRSGRRRGC